MTDGFEVVKKRTIQRNPPRLTVYQHGNGYLNAAACRDVFDDTPEYLRVLADSDGGRLGFKLTDGDDPDAYSVSGADNESGGDIQLKTALRQVGVDPETGELDADVIETGTSKSQRDRIKNIKTIIQELEQEYETGAPMEVVIDEALQLRPAPVVQTGDVAPVAISDLVASHDRSPQRKPDSQASDWLDIRQSLLPVALAVVIRLPGQSSTTA